MSKKPVAAAEQPQSAGTDPTAFPPAPCRTLGFLIMTAIIAFVAWFMLQQGEEQGEEQVEEAERLASAADPASHAGFRADAWFLPDEPLLGFVEIPAGPFTMGSNPGRDRMAYENERWSRQQLQGQVSVPRFFIARFETTVDQFRVFVRDTGIGSAALESAAPGNHPVSRVTWPEALAYGRWLKQQMLNADSTPAALRELLMAGAEITLPTEAQWEKAARGSDGRIFPWGTQPSARFANFQSAAPRPVGAMACPECSYGLADMAGNVWELTRSPMQPYPYTEADDVEPLGSDPLYVMRGGSFADAVNNVRSAVRGAVDPGVRNPGIGFRVVISQP